MPASKKEEWIEANAAALILSKNSDHRVSSDYVRLLAQQNKIRSRVKDGRTKEYMKRDVEEYRVRKNNVSEKSGSASKL